MDSNPTICEEKLTTSNPNRKWGFIEKQSQSTPGPVLDFGPERGPGKGTMADLGPLIRHLVSTRLPSGGRAAFLSPLSPMHGTRPSV